MKILHDLGQRTVLSSAVIAFLSLAAFGQEVPPTDAKSTVTPPQTATATRPPADTTKATPAPENKSRPELDLGFGPEFRFYRPDSAKVANRFSSSWRNFGLIFNWREMPKPGLHFDHNVTFLEGKSGDNRVYIVPLQLGAMQTWNNRRNSYSLGLAGGGCGLNIKAVPEAVNAGWRFTPAATLTGRAKLSQVVSLELRYYRMTPVRGFDFSGASLSTGLRF
jgi:hypothetical protein